VAGAFGNVSPVVGTESIFRHPDWLITTLVQRRTVARNLERNPVINCMPGF
jgi:hypothetical protein